jgi:hypothetical protein
MIELAEGLAGGMLQHSRKMVGLVAVHGTDDRDFVDHLSHVRKPVGDGDAGFPVSLERSQARDYGTLHGRVIVAEADRIHDFACMPVVLRIECVDVAHAAAHEEVDHRFRARCARKNRIAELPVLGPQRSQRRAQEAGGRLQQKTPARNAPAGINALQVTGHI